MMEFSHHGLGCSATCGGGYRSKSRECVFPQSVERLFDADNPCKGPLEVIEECSKQVRWEGQILTKII